VAISRLVGTLRHASRQAERASRPKPRATPPRAGGLLRTATPHRAPALIVTHGGDGALVVTPEGDIGVATTPVGTRRHLRSRPTDFSAGQP